MKPDQTLTWVQDGTERLRAQLAGLPDDGLDGATALPGWNRRYLFSHLAANADALRNLVHWARTGEERRMYASAQSREEVSDSIEPWNLGITSRANSSYE